MANFKYESGTKLRCVRSYARTFKKGEIYTVNRRELNSYYDIKECSVLVPYYEMDNLNNFVPVETKVDNWKKVLEQ